MSSRGAERLGDPTESLRGVKRRSNPTESSRGAQLRGDLIKLNKIATALRARNDKAVAMLLSGARHDVIKNFIANIMAKGRIG
jgi:hypothetical protein